MTLITRTINPLPFGDLEPRRFEDLVRQLAYDFKSWRRLEATGRSGSDEGFDARGFEIVTNSDSETDVEADEDADRDETADRLWLIQCKREKSIGPKKLRKHLDEIVLDPSSQLYGLVFAAACEFSKSSRDQLASWCSTNGLSEWHVWGRAELEDMLFQPRFDHLLFAYFGISLRIRTRSLATELRRQIAIKRRLKRFLDGTNERLVLIRDIADKYYPVMPPNGEHPRFRVRQADALSAYGLVLRISMRQAWLSEDGTKLDVALAVKNHHGSHADPWNQTTQAEEEIYDKAAKAWFNLPENERAWLYAEGILPYENIIVVDDIGDNQFGGPHLYVTGWESGFSLFNIFIETIEHPTKRSTTFDLDDPRRTARFPEETRHPRRRPAGY